MRKLIVSVLFFLGLMLILRGLLEGIPKWRASRERRKRERSEDS